MTKIDVLDKGYVNLVHHVGDDLTVVNSARASYEKRSEEMSDRDERLINFLYKHNHSSVFRHCFVTYEVRAPLMIARQHYKYAVGSNVGEHTIGWNEASRRYVSGNTEFYIPQADEWRSAPENSKQGSGAPLPTARGHQLMQWLIETVDEGVRKYELAMEMGACAEQARLFLPAYGLYVSYYWSASLQSVLHFLAQRLAHDAQEEITAYAQAVCDLTEPLFPVTFEKAFGNV